ncbi:MAG: hypothetical protein BGO01_11055 [Armatimonadetes bacterium 55-13]|nr:ATP-binding protein [Armatimonadota bacterium]OJU62925.1 MAG: hypothetical protein BGO01_11055 [Armatimonadetes bacterium 55-13]
MIERLAAQELREALSDTPVVLIHGPRQCGKSTLAKQFAEEGRRYITFDNPRHLAEAKSDPLAFLETYDEPLVLDEVQRVPEIFLPLKLKVDENRQPGRYLLTGSANVLALPKIADSLAGRMAIIDLLPFSQAEVEGAETNFVQRIFEGDIPKKVAPVDEEDILRRIVRGGFPEPSTRPSASGRERWFNDYLRTMIERDVRDIANIDALSQVPRILKLIASRSGTTMNVASLSRDTNIPNTSLHRYLDLLKAIFVTQGVPPWSNNHGARLTKTPKTYLVDSGFLCLLENISESAMVSDRDKFAAVLESFVAMELKKLARFSDIRPELHHLRTVRNLEVDFVLEARGGSVIGIQLKASKTLNGSETEGLRYLGELAEGNFKHGIVLYTGTQVEPLAKNITALPLSTLWS